MEKSGFYLREAGGTGELREVLTPYGRANNLDFGNTFLWD